VDHSSPARGQSFNVNAAINISPSPGPDVYYQWRKNGVPIPSKSGKCTFNNSDQTYSAGTYTVTSAQCPDTGSYSVAFTNQYWKIVSTDAPITVYDQGNPLPLVTLAVSPPYPPEDLPYVWITDPGNPPTLTATACFSALCAQWYTSACGTKIPIPEATGFSYKFPNPVTLDFLGSGCFEVEVFDEGGIPHEAIFYAYASW
jgi:hypothetical protein